MSAIPDSVPPPAAASSPDGRATGVRANIGAGIKEGVIGTLSQIAGAPADLVTRVPNMALKYAGLPQIPTTTDAVSGILTGIGGSPDMVAPPSSTSEKVARATGRGVGAMAAGGVGGLPGLAEAPLTALAAGAGGGALGEVAKEAVPERYGPAAELAGNVIGGGLVAGPMAAGKALVGPIADRVGSAVMDTAVRPFTSAGQTQLAAARVANAASDPAAVRATLASPPSPLVPGSEPTSFQLTGDQGLGALERGARNNVQFQPQFTARAGQQNAAQTAALENAAPPVDASTVGPWFRQQLADLNTAGETQTGAARTATQAAVDATGNPITAGEAGSVVRQGVEQVRAPMVAAADQSVAAAQTRAGQTLEGLGGAPVEPGTGESALQRYGQTMRGAAPAVEEPGSGLVGAQAPVKASAGKLFDALDPEGTLALPVAPVVQAAKEIMGGVNTRMGGALTSAEQPVLQAASSLRPVELFSDLRSLRSNTTTALRDISSDPKLGRESPPFRRMSMLLSSIDDTISGAAHEQAAREAPAVAAGAMPAESGIVGRLNGAADGGVSGARGGIADEVLPAGQRTGAAPGGGGSPADALSGTGGRGSPGAGALPSALPTRRAESLRDFLISRGGIKDQGGELAANDLNLLHHRAGGRLVNNSTGLSLDYAREAAVEAGFPLRSNDVNGLLDAVTQQADVYRAGEAGDQAAMVQARREAAREAADRVTFGANVDEAVGRLGTRLSPAETEHATALHMLGADAEDAVHQAAREGDERALQANAEHNAVGAPGVPLAAQQSELGVNRAQLEPNFSAKDQQALQTANQAYREYKERFRTGAVGDVLASDARQINGYRVPDSAVPAKLFGPGGKGAEAADSLMRATGSRDGALQVLGDYPAYSLRSAAVGSDGLLSMSKYAQWMKQHADVLQKFPDLAAKFQTVADARATLADALTRRQALEDTHPLRPGWGDAEVMQRLVKPGPQGLEAAGNLIKAVGNSPKAIEATKDYLASSLRDAAEVKSGPETGTLDPKAYARWAKQYDTFLSHPAMADLRGRFQTAADAQATLDQSAAAHVTARQAFERSVARHFLGQDVDPVTSMGSILESKSALPQMSDLARQTARDPVARQALQSAALQYVLRRVQSNRVVGTDLGETYLKSEQLQNMVRAHVGEEGAGALRQILTPAQLDTMNKVALDMRRANLSNQGPAGSPTALNESAKAAHAHSPTVAGSLIALETLGEAGAHILGPVGRLGAMFLKPVYDSLHSHGYAKVDALVADAALNPAKMKALFDAMPTRTQMPGRLAALKSQIAALAASSSNSGPDHAKQ